MDFSGEHSLGRVWEVEDDSGDRRAEFRVIHFRFSHFTNRCSPAVLLSHDAS